MEETTKLKEKMQAAGVSMYAVAKQGGWSWQQVASWCKGRTTPQLNTFIELQRILGDKFGVEITIEDLQTI